MKALLLLSVSDSNRGASLPLQHLLPLLLLFWIGSFILSICVPPVTAHPSILVNSRRDGRSRFPSTRALYRNPRGLQQPQLFWQSSPLLPSFNSACSCSNIDSRRSKRRRIRQRQFGGDGGSVSNGNGFEELQISVRGGATRSTSEGEVEFDTSSLSSSSPSSISSTINVAVHHPNDTHAEMTTGANSALSMNYDHHANDGVAKRVIEQQRKAYSISNHNNNDTSTTTISTSMFAYNHRQDSNEEEEKDDYEDDEDENEDYHTVGSSNDTHNEEKHQHQQLTLLPSSSSPMHSCQGSVTITGGGEGSTGGDGKGERRIARRERKKRLKRHKLIAKQLKNRNARNMRRKVMHACFGLTFAALNHALPKSTFVPCMALLSSATLMMELLRYRKGFGWMNHVLHTVLGQSLRKHEMEGKFTGSFYFFTGVTFTSWLFDSTSATLGICQLALADPSASYFGRKTRHIYWSRIENGLGGFGRNKGVLGFLGGALFCFPFNYRVLSVAVKHNNYRQLHPSDYDDSSNSVDPQSHLQSASSVSTWIVATASILLGLAGALADLAVPTPALTLPRKILGVRVPPFHIDDNMVVPIFSAYACQEIFKVLHLQGLELTRSVLM